MKQIPEYKQIRKNQKIKLVKEAGWYHGVYDVLKDNFVCLSQWMSTVNALGSNLINALPKYNVNFSGNTLPPEANVSEPWAIVWDFASGKWKYDPSVATDDLIYRYHLLAEKAAVLDLINDRMQMYRRPVASSLFLQDSIYAMKYQEAREILDHPGPIDDPSQWPFVYDYADLEDIDIIQAANDIIMKNKFYRTRLSSTEKLRLRYQRMVIDCTDITQLDAIRSQFYVEGDIYGRV